MASFLRNGRKNWLMWAVGLLLSVFLIAILAGVGVLVRQFDDFRASMQYPNSVELSSHENYSQLLSGFRWDATYLSQDDFRDVFSWYSTKYNMGAEDTAIGRCSYVEVVDRTALTLTVIGMHLCDTNEGRHINVTRQTRYGKIFSISAWRDLLRDQF